MTCGYFSATSMHNIMNLMSTHLILTLIIYMNVLRWFKSTDERFNLSFLVNHMHKKVAKEHAKRIYKF